VAMGKEKTPFSSIIWHTNTSNSQPSADPELASASTQSKRRKTDNDQNKEYTEVKNLRSSINQFLETKKKRNESAKKKNNPEE